jgi:hypothetical protein
MTSERKLRDELRGVEDVIDRAYWAFTRQARAKPPVLVCPDAYKRRAEIKAELLHLKLSGPTPAVRRGRAEPK